MKIAYLILAHCNPAQLRRMILRLNQEDVVFIVHIDGKLEGRAYQDMADAVARFDNAFLTSRRVRVDHYQFNMVEATLVLIDEVFDRQIAFDRAFLLSGVHYPIKSNQEMALFLSQNPDKEYINYCSPPRNNGLWRGKLDWVECFWECEGKMKRFPAVASGDLEELLNRSGLELQDLITKGYFNERVGLGDRLRANSHKISSSLGTEYPEVYESVLELLRKSLGTKRRFPQGFKFFAGWQWWCLTRDCLAYIRHFVGQNREFVDFFRFVLVPDEMFFQTIVLNSHFAPQVVNDDLLYLEWDPASKAHPRIFNSDDIHVLSSSNDLFARKFDVKTEPGILDLIDRDLLANKGDADESL